MTQRTVAIPILTIAIIFSAPIFLGMLTGVPNACFINRAVAQEESACAEKDAEIESLETELSEARQTIDDLTVALSDATEPEFVAHTFYDSTAQEIRAESGFVIGDPAAPITFVAFEDFMCPHCQNFTRAVIDPMLEHWVAHGWARFEYRVLPVVDPVLSTVTANLVICADQLGGSFWEAHDIMFQITSSQIFDESSVRTFYDSITLDATIEQLVECASQDGLFTEDVTLAQTLGVRATPTMYILEDDGSYTLLETNDLREIAGIINDANGS